MEEMLQNKKKEMEEKYADIINDLCVKYDKTVDIGFDMLTAICRAKKANLQPEYETEIEYNEEELMKDYEEYVGLAEDKAKADGLIGIE